MKILITGSCGFIGFNLACHLLKKGFKIFGIDNIGQSLLFKSPIPFEKGGL